MSHHHDAWFRDEVAKALVEVDDPAVERIPHDGGMTSWQQQRAQRERQAADRTT